MIRLTIIINEDEHLFPIITNTDHAAMAILSVLCGDWPDPNVTRVRIKVDDYPDSVVIEPSDWRPALDEQAEGRFNRGN